MDSERTPSPTDPIDPSLLLRYAPTPIPLHNALAACSDDPLSSLLTQKPDPSTSESADRNELLIAPPPAVHLSRRPSAPRPTIRWSLPSDYRFKDPIISNSIQLTVCYRAIDPYNREILVFRADRRPASAIQVGTTVGLNTYCNGAEIFLRISRRVVGIRTIERDWVEFILERKDADDIIITLCVPIRPGWATLPWLYALAHYFLHNRLPNTFRFAPPSVPSLAEDSAVATPLWAPPTVVTSDPRPKYSYF